MHGTLPVSCLQCISWRLHLTDCRIQYTLILSASVIGFVSCPCIYISFVFISSWFWPSKVQVFAAAGALYSLNAHCNTMFIPFGQKGCHLMGQCCPVCPLKVNEGLCNCLLSYKQLCVIYSFTAVSNKIKTSVCNVFYFIDKYQYLGRICCPYLQGRRVEVKVSATAKTLVPVCWNDINRC